MVQEYRVEKRHQEGNHSWLPINSDFENLSLKVYFISFIPCRITPALNCSSLQCLLFFSERILEDLETLDPNKIADYNEKNDFEKDSFGASDFIRLGHDYSKYFLVLRQSTMKYDMFRRHQVKLILLS